MSQVANGIQVVQGDPTPEELAALVVVLASAARTTARTTTVAGGEWAAYWRRLRTPIAPGPNAWRQSARP